MFKRKNAEITKKEMENSKSTKVLKLFSLLILCISMVFVVIINVFADVSVKVKINRNPKVDIVIAKGASPLDLTDFETDVKQKLNSDGINTDNVNFQKIDTSIISTASSDAATIFNQWEQFPVSADVGNWSWYNANWRLDSANGTIYTTADVNCTGFWDTSKIDASDYTINFDVISQDSWADPYQFMFRMARRTESRNNYSFYVVSFTGGSNGETPQIALSKITSWIPSTSDSYHCGPGATAGGIYVNSGVNATGSTLSCINNPGMAIDYAWLHCKIEAYGNNIKVYINNSSTPLIEYTDTDNPFLTGAYGPAVISNPTVKFKNINVESKSYKSDEEVLRNINWAPNSSRLVISADSSEEKGSNYEMISRMLDQNVYYEGIGSNKNKTSIEELIRQNASNGIYVDDSDYNTVVNQTANYIKQILSNNNENSNYIILEDGSTLSSNPLEYQSGTTDLDWPYGRWKIVHDADYFENGNGQFENSESYIDALPSELNKVGQYVFTFQDANVDPLYIYVHRKPVAKFSLNLANRTATLRNTSYDLDKQSQNNGIAEEEWSYKKNTDTNWTTASSISTLNLDANSTYFIRLRVKDYQDTWSEYSTKYIVTDSQEIPTPVAAFDIVNDTISYYHNLEIMNDSYDPAGNEITTYKWTITKKQEDGSYITIAEDLEEPIVDFNVNTNTSTYASQLGEGEYKISLVVENDKGKVSEEFAKSVIITNDITAPEFLANPLSYETTNETIDVNLKFTDEESGFDYYKYAIQYGDETALEWSENIYKEIDTITLNRQDEDMHIHIIAVDKAGNESKDRVLGTYRINQKTFELEIHLTDSVNSVNLGKAEFELVHPKLNSPDERIVLHTTTDIDGICHFNGYSMGKGTYEYIINQTKAPGGYEDLSITSLKITFDEAGNITNVESKNLSDTNVNGWDNEKIILTMNANKKPVSQQDIFNVRLQAQFEENTDKKVEGYTYTIVAEAESGEVLSITDTTNEEGIIEINNKFSGYGEIVISIIRNQITEDGIVQVEKEAVINKTSDGITYVRWKSNEKIEGNITGNTVELILNEETKGTENKIQVQVVEASDEATVISGVKVNLKDLKTGLNTQLVTDSDGVIKFDAPEHYKNPNALQTETALRAGKFEFEISIVEISDEYIKPSTQKLTIYYDENGDITKVEENSSSIMYAIFSRKEEINSFVNYAIVKLKVTESQNYKQYALEISKTDRDNQTKVLAGIEYEIVMKTGNTEKRAVKTTDSSGKLSLQIAAKGTTQLIITEKKTQVGYILKNSPVTTTLTLGTDGNFISSSNSEIQLENPYKVIKDGVEVIEGSRKITYNDTSIKKISASNQGKKANITFNLIDTDDYGNALGKVEFQITELKTNQMFNGLVTSTNGKATLPEFPIYTEGKYVFELQIVQKAIGFKDLDSKITVEITYAIVNDEMKAIKHIITTGNKYVTSKEFEQYESAYSYQLNCNLTIKNIRDLSKSKLVYLDLKDIDKYDESIVLNGKYNTVIMYSEKRNGVDWYNYLNYGDIQVIDGIELPIYLCGENTSISLYQGNTIGKAPLGYEPESASVGLSSTNNNWSVLHSSYSTSKMLQVKNSNYTVSDVLEVTIPKERKMLAYSVKTVNTIDDISNYYISGVKHRVNNETLEEGSNEKGEQVFEDFKGGGKIELTLQELSVPYGYKLDSKEYKLVFYRNPDDLTMTYIEEESDFPAECVVSDNKNLQVVLNVKNDLDFSINIQKIDSLNVSKKLKGAKFEITSTNSNHESQTIVTDENGMAKAIYDRVVPNTTIIYTIKEVEAPEGYRKSREFRLRIEFDKDGKIKKYEILKNNNQECDWVEIYSPQQYVRVGTEYILNPDVYINNSQITLKVKDSNRYSFVLNKIDQSTISQGQGATQITGAEFDITITHNGTTESYHKATLDGIIRLKELNGNGKIYIRYQETAAAFGYVNNGANGTIVFEIDEKTKQMTLNTEETTVDLSNVTIDNELGEVRTTVENESNFKMGLKLVDAISGMTLDGARFEVRTDIGDTDTKETVNGGEAIFKVGKVHKSTTITYRIMELIAPTGYPQVYNPIDDIVIQLHYDQYGRIQYTIVEGKNRISNIEVPNNRSSISSNFKENELNIEITNGEQDEYTLKLIKENEENSNIKIQGTQFSIVGKNEDGTEQFNKPLVTTNSNGEITIEHVDIQDGFSVIMQEIQNSDGYVFDDTIRVVNFSAKFSENGAKIIEATTDDPRTILQVDNINNVIKMRVTNEPRNVSVVINKADKNDNNIYLANAKIQIRDMDSGKTYNVMTGEDGVGYTNILIKPDGTYQYKLIEEQAPLGYKKANEMAIEIDFEDDQVKAVRRLQQADIFKIEEVRPRYIELTIEDEQKSGELEEYTLEVRRVNQLDTTEAVPNADTKIEVTNAEYAALTKRDKTNQGGSIYMNNVLKGPGQTVVKITEMDRVEGYEWNSADKLVFLDRNSETDQYRVVSAQGISTNRVLVDNTNKIVTIIVGNYKKDVFVSTNEVVRTPFTVQVLSVIKGTENTAAVGNYTTTISASKNSPRTSYTFGNKRTERRQTSGYYWNNWTGRNEYYYNELGTITMSGIYGNENIDINVKHDSALSGLKMLDREQNIKVYRDESTGQFRLVEEGENTQTTFDQNLNRIIIRIEIEPTFEINIEKQDSVDTLEKLSGVEFDVISSLGTSTHVTTATGGAGLAITGESVPNRTVLYRIVETKKPDGYKVLPSEIELKVTFDSRGLVSNYIITKGTDFAEIFFPEQISYSYSGYHTLAINRDIYKGTGAIKILINNDNTYRFLIQNEDEEINGMKIEGSKFKLTVTDSNGTQNDYIGENDGKTNSNGIWQVNNLKGEGIIDLHYEQIEAGEGYRTNTGISGDIRIYKDPVNYRVRLLSYSGDENDLQVDEEEGIIRLIARNERKLELEIEKVDINNSTSKLSNVEFKITSQVIERNNMTVVEEVKEEGTLVTDFDGIATIDLGKADRFTKVAYELEETVAPTGYNKIGNIRINVTYDDRGQIKTIQNITSARAKAYKAEMGKIGMRITNGNTNVNSRGENVLGYDFKIQTVDKMLENYPVEGVVYNVKVYQNDTLIRQETVNSATTYISGIVVGKGIAEVENLIEDGTIKVEVVEEDTVEGYVIDNTLYTVQFNVTYGQAADYTLSKDLIPTITLDDENTTADISSISINNTERTITLNLEQEPQVLLGIKQKLIDNNLIMPTSEYKVTALETNGELYLGIYDTRTEEGEINTLLSENTTATTLNETAITDIYGEAYVSLGRPIPDKTVVYVIDRKEETGEYTNVTKLAILYDSYGKIRRYYTIKYNLYVEIDPTEDFTDTSHVYINVYMDEISQAEPYDLEIVKVDSNNKNITIEGAKLQIEVTNEQGDSRRIGTTDVTDEEGKIVIKEISGSGNIEIKIKELEAPAGRKLDSTENVIDIYRETTTGKMTMMAGENIDYDITDRNKIILYVANEQEDNLYSISVKKVDGAKTAIEEEGIMFNISIDGNEQTYSTNEKGEIILTNLILPERVGTYTLKIEEIKAPEGYVISKSKIEAEVKIEEDNGVRIIDGVTIKNGGNATLEKVTKNYIGFEIENKMEEEIYLRSTEYLIGTGEDKGEWLPGEMSEYKEGDMYIKGIRPRLGRDMAVEKQKTEGTYLKEFLSNIETNAEEIKVYIPEKNERGEVELRKVLEEKEANKEGEGLIGTGMILKLTKGSTEIEITIIVRGDFLNSESLVGDGKIQLWDITTVKSINSRNLKKNYVVENQQAVDYYLNGNSSVNFNTTGIKSAYETKDIEAIR